MIALIRLRQGLRALAALAFSPPVDTMLAGQYLTPEQLHAFGKLKRAEQLHSVRVLRAVLEQEPDTPPALAIAALMHDIGKTRHPISLPGKTLPVLVKAVAPALFARLSEGSPERWFERPFVTYTHHPRWSGEILDSLHAPADAVWLAVHHAEKAEQWRDHRLYGLLVRLQAADDQH